MRKTLFPCKKKRDVLLEMSIYITPTQRAFVLLSDGVFSFCMHRLKRFHPLKGIAQTKKKTVKVDLSGFLYFLKYLQLGFIPADLCITLNKIRRILFADGACFNTCRFNFRPVKEDRFFFYHFFLSSGTPTFPEQ